MQNTKYLMAYTVVEHDYITNFVSFHIIYIYHEEVSIYFMYTIGLNKHQSYHQLKLLR